jgi:hypothetical protein
MCEHKVYLQPEKCEFEKTKIEYLSVIISHNKVEMDPVKIAGVADWPTPSNKKEVQSFISFINFYRRFIPGFSHHVRALFDLTMKDVRFMWGLPQEDSFMKLKELVTSAPVLILPNNNLLFRLEVSGELPLTYLPLDPFLIVYFLFPFSLLSIPTPSIFTGSISSDCDHYGHSHCKGTSVLFLTSPILPYSPLVHIYFSHTSVTSPGTTLKGR